MCIYSAYRRWNDCVCSGDQSIKITVVVKVGGGQYIGDPPTFLSGGGGGHIPHPPVSAPLYIYGVCIII